MAVYWSQWIACFVFATVAMFSGISGAALMLLLVTAADMSMVLAETTPWGSS